MAGNDICYFKIQIDAKSILFWLKKKPKKEILLETIQTLENK
jgi:hypothetical protein